MICGGYFLLINSVGAPHYQCLFSLDSQLIHQLLGSLQVNADFLFLSFFFFKFYTTSCLKSSECMCVIKMAFSQFELVLGNICLGMGVVRYLECPVSSPAPSPGF